MPVSYKPPVEDLSTRYQAEGGNSSATQKSNVKASASQKNDHDMDDMKVREDIYIVQKGDTLYSISRQLNITTQNMMEANDLNDQSVLLPGQKLLLPLGTNITKKQDHDRIKTDTKEKTTLASSSKGWVWPAQGEIIQRYQENNNKGIDIAGNLGQSIFAIADGQVIYVGDDLIGYGNMIILNHYNGFMAAYAHNKKILVQEGMHVTKGQVISHMGKTEDGQVKLHFEIRKNGNPVNPLMYLPEKNMP